MIRGTGYPLYNGREGRDAAAGASECHYTEYVLSRDTTRGRGCERPTCIMAMKRPRDSTDQTQPEKKQKKEVIDLAACGEGRC